MSYTAIQPVRGIVTSYSFPGIPNRDKNRFYETQKINRVIAVEERLNLIIKAIERVTIHTKEQIFSRSKVGLLPSLRAIIAEYLYEPGVVSLKDTAKLLGGRDHTTIVYYIRTAIKKIKNDPYLYKTYQDIYTYL